MLRVLAVLVLLSVLGCKDEVRLRVKVATRDAGVTHTSTTSP